jgi:Zinc carboxypeptidase
VTRARPVAALLAAVLLAAPALARDVPTPASVLGFTPGDDRKLADWSEITGYFRRLDAASDRVRVDEVGQTTEGRPFLIVTITSAANMARLEEIRRDNLRLADPRGLGDEEAAALLARGKTIVAANYAIHSTEVAGFLTPLVFAHRLAASDAPEVAEMLDRVVLLVIPSHNPDGTDLVTAWYRKTLGTPFEGKGPPVLYQKYTGHDNNRDWYMFTQQESLLTVRHLYDRWRPQVVLDVHQMGEKQARTFLPPYTDPWEPNVDPALRAAVTALGTDVAARLQADGRTGVVVHALYDAWTPARAYPHTHGGVRILSETASAHLASPVEIPFESLDREGGFDAKVPSWNFPRPWPGGTWRLRDIVDIQLAVSSAVLGHAARNRDFWLRTFLDVNRRASARREPFAFVLPREQRDPLSTVRLLRVLRDGGVEVHRARAAFEAGKRTYEAGSHVVLMQQPWSAFAKMLLERQRYPDRRAYAGGPPLRPYDVTAHTLPLLLGVQADAVESAFSTDLDPVTEAAPAPGRIEGTGSLFAFPHGNAGLVALGRLVGSGVKVLWTLESFSAGASTFPAGTFLVPASARASLLPLTRELGLVAHGVAASPPSLVVGKPRVGVYASWVPSMDEGWTRYVLEKDVGMPYVTLHDADVRAGRLRERFDAIVLPSQPPAAILAGHAPGSMPDEYTGGLGTAGVAALRAFVDAGGTLLALDAATLFAIEQLRLPVANGLATLDPASFYCPGAILETEATPAPLTHGLDRSVPVWFETSPAFDVTSGSIALRYAADDPLLSGWLLGGAHLKGRAALVEVPLGRGRVVLFGFRPQYRAQSWQTYVPFLNALYLSAARPRP